MASITNQIRVRTAEAADMDAIRALFTEHITYNTETSMYTEEGRRLQAVALEGAIRSGDLSSYEALCATYSPTTQAIRDAFQSFSPSTASSTSEKFVEGHAENDQTHQASACSSPTVWVAEALGENGDGSSENEKGETPAKSEVVGFVCLELKVVGRQNDELVVQSATNCTETQGDKKKEELSGEIRRMTVTSRCRGKGVGRVLLSRLENYASCFTLSSFPDPEQQRAATDNATIRLRRLHLGTFSGFQTACSFYDKMGYTMVGQTGPYRYQINADSTTEKKIGDERGSAEVSSSEHDEFPPWGRWITYEKCLA